MNIQTAVKITKRLITNDSLRAQNILKSQSYSTAHDWKLRMFWAGVKQGNESALERLSQLERMLK